jgi:hypothetical protein
MWPVSRFWVNTFKYVSSADVSPQEMYGVFSWNSRLEFSHYWYSKATTVAWVPDGNGKIVLGKWQGFYNLSEKGTNADTWSYMNFGQHDDEFRFLGAYYSTTQLTNPDGREIKGMDFCIPYLLILLGSLAMSGVGFTFAFLYGRPASSRPS